MLQQQGTRILMVLFVVMLAIWVIFSLLRSETDLPSSELQALTLTHVYSNGHHEYRGNVTLPTPCHRLDVAASAAGNRVAIALRAVPDEGVCIQVIDERDFYVRIAAPLQANVTATLNGAPLEVAVVPAP